MIHDSAVTTYKNPERAPWALSVTPGGTVPPHSHPPSDITGLAVALASLVLANTVTALRLAELTAGLATKQPLGEYHIGLFVSETETTF